PPVILQASEAGRLIHLADFMIPFRLADRSDRDQGASPHVGVQRKTGSVTGLDVDFLVCRTTTMGSQLPAGIETRTHVDRQCDSSRSSRRWKRAFLPRWRR